MTGRAAWELVPPEDRVAIPEDEMRAILGLPAPPFNNGGIVGGMKLATTIATKKVVPIADAAIAYWAAKDVADTLEWMRMNVGIPSVEHVVQIWRRSFITGAMFGGKSSQGQPEADTPRARAIPKPSHTPPFWAQDRRRSGRAGRNHL